MRCQLGVLFGSVQLHSTLLSSDLPQLGGLMNLHIHLN